MSLNSHSVECVPLTQGKALSPTELLFGVDELLELQQGFTSTSPKGIGGLTNVAEEDATKLSCVEFNERYRMKAPVLLKGCAKLWPCSLKWNSSENWKESMRDANGSVLVSLDNTNFLYHELCVQSNESMISTIERILTRGSTEDRRYCRLYLSENPSLIDDIVVSELERLAGIEEKHFVAKNCGVWISSAGCVTPLHYDLCHGFLCQVGTALDHN